MVGVIPAASEAIGILMVNWPFLIIGLLVGMLFGAIPGMGGTVTLTILVPFSVRLDPAQAFILFGTALGATTFAGSISAILLNTPGTGSNAATLLDGYPLTRKGKAANAIGASAVSSAGGAVVGLFAFLILIPVVIEIALLFGNSEIFWLAAIGLLVLPLLAGDRILAGLTIACVGLLFAFTGPALRTGEIRFSHDIALLLDGIGLVPAIVGLFAVAEMLRLAAQNESVVEGDTVNIGGSKLEGIKDVIRHKWLWFRCSVMGVLIGAIPGVGGTVASFVAYGHAVQTSSNSHEFGDGRIEGVIASESANDAKDGGQLFPTLGLGIPGSGSTAILLGGFILHGIQPGPGLLQDELPLMLVIVFSLIFANIFTSALGLIFTKQLSKIAEIPIGYLAPSILILSLTSVYISRSNFPDIYLAVLFGLFGVVLIHYNVSRIPIIIALVLGDIFENNFYLALQIGESPVEAFLTGWLNQLLIIFLLITVLFPVYRPLLEKVSLRQRILP